MKYRAKWQIALELYDRAAANGIEFEWLTFDEGYGSKGELLRELDRRNQLFVGEVPSTMTGWLRRPALEHPPAQRGPGRPLYQTRVAKDQAAATPFRDLLTNSPMFAKQPWERYRVKDGDKGPMIWEVKHSLIYRPENKSIADKRWHLLIARNTLKPYEVKYFLSNAPASTSVEQLLLVGFS